MLRLLTIISSCLILCFYSCKKDDAFTKLNFGKNYYKEKVEKAGRFRVFAKSGEITTPSILERFELEDSSRFTLYANSYMQNSWMDSVTFYNDYTARLVSLSSQQLFDYSTDETHIILLAKDITEFYSSGDLFSKSFLNQIGRYKPQIISEELKSSVAGAYLFVGKGKQKYVFNSRKGKVSTPNIAIIRHSTCCNYFDFLNNELSDNFYTSIPGDDTVAVQQFLVTYQ